MTGIAAAPGSRSLGWGSLISFAGSAVSALMGFAMTLIVSRTLGQEGAGVVFQSIAVFTIATSLSKFGMDSVAIWLLPRLVTSDIPQLRSALLVIVTATAVLGAVAGFLVILVVPQLFPGGDAGRVQLREAIATLGWFVPLGGLVLVLLAAIRGLGALWPYVGIGSFGLPIMRPLLIAAATASGASAVAVTLTWALPLPVALVAALISVRLQVVRLDRRLGTRTSYRPSTAQIGSIGRFALPRTVSAALEQSVDWMQVLLVGGMVGTAAAGVYAGASRMMTAGLMIDSAIRVVVSPRFSALLHARDLQSVQTLYRTTAVWLVLFSGPIYITLALFASTVLHWLGPGFEAGGTVLVILCVGAGITLIAGNVHSVLLMSGRSGWAATNKAIALVVNLTANVALVPHLGLAGAATAYALAQMVDAVIASVQIRRFVGLRIELWPILYGIIVPSLCVGVPGGLIRWRFGSEVSSLSATVLIGGALFLGWCVLDRRRLQLAGFGHSDGTG